MFNLATRVARTSALTAALVAGGMSCVMAAPVTIYTDLASWTAAVSGTVVLEDFNDATLLSGFSISQGGTVGSGIYLGTALTQFNDAANPKWNFGTSKAFGADFDLSPGGRGDGLVLALTFGDGTTGQALILNPPSATFTGFFGAISTVAITSVRFDSPGTGKEAFSADNLRFVGAGVAVPEPGSLALALVALGAGFLAIRASRRRTSV